MKSWQKSPQVIVLSAILFGLSACLDLGEDSPSFTPAYPDGCQPLYAGWDCFLPYPSNFFLRENDETLTGYEIHHEGEGKLLTVEEFSADVNDWKTADGFSLHPPIVFAFEERVDISSCVQILDDKIASLQKDHCTLILDENGEAVPHFVDVDGRADSDGLQMVILRPLGALAPQSTYVVAVQNLKDLQGNLIQAPEGFRELRDEEISSAETSALEKKYREVIFPLVTRFGLSPKELQLAWDFTTGSREWALTDMLQSRDLVLAWLDSNQPTIEINSLHEESSGTSAYTAYGKITGPLVMENPAPGALLARDDSGLVRLNGEVTFPFVATIPRSIIDSGSSGFPLIYGHGFFGERSEGEGGNARNIGNEMGAVVFSIDWQGMSLHDMGPVVANLGYQAAYALQFTDRVAQGMVNQLVLGRAIKNQMGDLPEFQFDDGTPLFLSDNLNFMGISQGHILGGVLAALSPDISNYCLNVGGAVFTHMMSRAIPFDAFLMILDVSMPDPFIQQKMIATLQPIFDRIDPAMWAPFVLSSPLPGDTFLPARNLLMQIAVADTSVPNFSSYQHARLLGLDLIGPSSVSPWGLPETQENAETTLTSGLTVFDYGIDDSFYAEANATGEATLAHEAVRKTPEALEQLRIFFKEGRVVNPCEGPCVLNPP